MAAVVPTEGCEPGYAPGDHATYYTARLVVTVKKNNDCLTRYGEIIYVYTYTYIPSVPLIGGWAQFVPVLGLGSFFGDRFSAKTLRRGLVEISGRTGR